MLQIEQASLKNEAESSQRKITELNKEIIRNEKQKFVLSDLELEKLFWNTQKNLETELNCVKSEMEAIPLFSRVIWTSEESFKLREFAKSIKRDIRISKSICKKLFNPKTTLKPIEKTNVAFEILCAFGYENDYIHKHLMALKDFIEKNKEKLQSEIVSEKNRVAQERIKCYERIKLGIEKIKNDAEREFKPLVAKVLDSQNRLIIEIKKLGLKPKMS